MVAKSILPCAGNCNAFLIRKKVNNSDCSFLEFKRSLSEELLSYGKNAEINNAIQIAYLLTEKIMSIFSHEIAKPGIQKRCVKCKEKKNKLYLQLLQSSSLHNMFYGVSSKSKIKLIL